MPDVSHVPSEVPLRLRPFGPVVIRERVPREPFAGASLLALEQLQVRREAGDDRPPRLRDALSGVGVGRVAVVDHPREELRVRAKRRKGRLELRGLAAGVDERADPRFRNDLLDDPRRSHILVGDRLGRRLLLPRVRLVPHVELGHPPLEVRGERTHPRFPRGPLGVRPFVELLAVAVERIAVVRLQHAADAAHGGVVHAAVDPGEVVLPLLLLALGPAALETDARDAERLQKLLVLLKVREVAVERLASEHPRLPVRLARAARGDGADPLHSHLERSRHAVRRRVQLHLVRTCRRREKQNDKPDCPFHVHLSILLVGRWQIAPQYPLGQPPVPRRGRRGRRVRGRRFRGIRRPSRRRGRWPPGRSWRTPT